MAPTMAELKALRDKRERAAQHLDERVLLTGQRIGSGAYDVSLAGARPGYVWVRGQDSSREQTQVRGHAARINMEVVCKKDALGVEYIARDLTAANNEAPDSYTDGGTEPPVDGRLQPVNLYPNNFTPGRGRQSTTGGLTITVEAFLIGTRYIAEDIFTLTAPGTAGKRASCAVVYDYAANSNLGGFVQITGTLLDDDGSTVIEGEWIASLALPLGTVPLVAYVLSNGQTAVTGSTRRIDLRAFSNVADARVNTSASTAPGVGNDSTQGYGVGSRWLDTTGNHSYTCLGAAVGAAVWVREDGGTILLGGFGEASVTTTDATVTTLAGIAVAEGEAVSLKAQVVGKKDDESAGAARELFIAARRAVAGNVTLIGAAHGTLLEDSSGTPAIDADVDTTTQTVRIRVTGIAAETWKWVARYDVARTAL